MMSQLDFGIAPDFKKFGNSLIFHLVIMRSMISFVLRRPLLRIRVIFSLSRGGEVEVVVVVCDGVRE